jgi:hypothetical protein
MKNIKDEGPKAWKPQVFISYIFPLPFFPLAVHASTFKLSDI